MNNNKDNKKKFVIIIGALAILLLLVGATYAYFSLNIISGNSKTQINATTSPIDNISLKKSDGDLHITLMSDDMALSTIGDYYAVSDADKNYDKNENIVSIAELTAQGGSNNSAYNCEVKVTITKNTDDTMVSVLKENDAEVRLSFGDLLEDIDLFGLKNAANIIKTGHITLINNSNDFINAYLKVSNTENHQEYLANKTLDINIDTEVIKCDVIGTSKIELALRNTNNSGTLSKHLTGGMFRYQGSATEVTDNYICFGTDNQQTCLNHQDQYMYRIIGVTPEGRLKLIKKEALDETYQWWEGEVDAPIYEDVMQWTQNEIYTSINGDGFLTNTTYVPTEWENKIYNNIWNYGVLGYSTLDNGEEFYLKETGKKERLYYKGATSDDGKSNRVVDNRSKYYNQIRYYKEVNNKMNTIVKSKIAIMYAHDYYLSVDDSVLCIQSDYHAQCKAGWLYLSHNDSSAPSELEWTMALLGYYTNSGWYLTFGINAVGALNGSYPTSERSIRPVFYLNNDIEISGKGTLAEPYMIAL